MPEQIHANGRAFPVTRSGPDQGLLWVLFPGYGYGLDRPALQVAQRAAEARGEAVCAFDTQYHSDVRLEGLARDEAVALIRADARALLADLPARPMIFVGKSVGCLALWEATLTHSARSSCG